MEVKMDSTFMRLECQFVCPNSFAFAKAASALVSRIVYRDLITFFPENSASLLCAPW